MFKNKKDKIVNRIYIEAYRSTEIESNCRWEVDVGYYTDEGKREPTGGAFDSSLSKAVKRAVESHRKIAKAKRKRFGLF